MQCTYSFVDVSAMYLRTSPSRRYLLLSLLLVLVLCIYECLPPGAHSVFMAKGTCIIWKFEVSLCMSLPRALSDPLP
jgi:hypothetical protein